MRSYIFKILLILAIGLSLAQVWAHDVKFEINPKTLKAGEKGVITATLSIPDGMGQSYDPEDLDYFFLRSEHPELSFSKTLYPKGYKSTEFGFKYAGSVTLSLPFSVKGTAKPGNKSLEAEMGYNLCFDDGNCEIPTSKKGKLQFTIAADAAVQENTGGTPELETPQEEAIAEPEPEPKSAIQAQATEETNSAEESTSDPLTILKYMLFALLGGLILNVTPCVLPILPIRLMSMVNQAQRGQGKVLVHSFVYTVGAMLSFGILAGIFIALRSAGEAQGWGFQNQNPYFTVGLMSVVYIFALSLLGVFVISAPGMNTATQASSKGGYSGSFFGGVFAFLMAISCTGPFLGLALPFAFKLTSVLLLLFFLIIGLGFALPFILVGFFPKFLKIIPKPGEWMNIFKEVMGFVLLYIVFTQLKTIYVLTGGEYLLNMVWYLIVVGFGIWLYGRFV
ncbi:MAG: cytochrome c biogenesis protein CcdA, partial [Candidatus Cloacimonetes bacterium]|nr:cytochrome c biogenesis protein CcdA [Candidatus Cloacimonadota bacterium]